MNPEANIIRVTADNIPEHPQVICYINPKHTHYPIKLGWLNEQFRYGLTVKLLYLPDEKRPVGFIEYVPGEYCWRAVDARGYMFIHCLWTYGKKHQHLGLGARLLEAVETDARSMRGVAVVTSDKSFMANKAIFLKNGYEVVAKSGKEQLLVKQFRKSALPVLNDWQAELAKHQGLSMVYSHQCPWVARFIEEVKPFLKKEGLDPTFTHLKTAAQAQTAPSLYGVFNLIYNGKLLADRYISTTRFGNIVKKEIKGSRG